MRRIANATRSGWSREAEPRELAVLAARCWGRRSTVAERWPFRGERRAAPRVFVCSHEAGAGSGPWRLQPWRRRWRGAGQLSDRRSGRCRAARLASTYDPRG